MLNRSRHLATSCSMCSRRSRITARASVLTIFSACHATLCVVPFATRASYSPAACTRCGAHLLRSQVLCVCSGLRMHNFPRVVRENPGRIASANTVWTKSAWTVPVSGRVNPLRQTAPFCINATDANQEITVAVTPLTVQTRFCCSSAPNERRRFATACNRDELATSCDITVPRRRVHHVPPAKRAAAAAALEFRGRLSVLQGCSSRKIPSRTFGSLASDTIML